MWLSIQCSCLPPNKHAFTAKAVWADFQKKGQGKKGKKGKKGKDDERKGKPGDGKGKSNYVQPQTSSNPSIQTQQQQAPQVQGMVLFLLLKLTQHVLMCCLPIMRSKSTTDALAEEVNINEMQWHNRTEKPRRGFLS